MNLGNILFLKQVLDTKNIDIYCTGFKNLTQSNGIANKIIWTGLKNEPLLFKFNRSEVALGGMNALDDASNIDSSCQHSSQGKHLPMVGLRCLAHCRLASDLEECHSLTYTASPLHRYLNVDFLGNTFVRERARSS